MRTWNATTIISCLVLAAHVWAQAPNVTAKFVAPRAIMVNGEISESAWSNATWHSILPNEIQTVCGSANGRNDISASFAALWDSTGLCVATKFCDDIHNAPWSTQSGLAHHSWKDDGMQWWVNFDFEDAWADATPPYFGQHGWIAWKGLAWKGGVPNDRYVTYRNDNSPVTATVSKMKANGFYAPYHSNDGINFECEAQFRWSSPMMGATGTPSAGKEIAFNMSVNDNDGTDMLACMLSWTGGTHNQYQGWGKITLEGNATSRPNASPVISHIHIDPYIARVGQEIILRANASDPDNDTLEYAWIIPGHPRLTGREASFTCRQTGEFPVALEVRDGYNGLTCDSTHSFRVTCSPISEQRAVFDSSAGAYSACKTFTDPQTKTQFKARIHPNGETSVYFWQEPAFILPDHRGWKLVKTVTVDFAPDFAPKLMLSKYVFSYEQRATKGITEERFLRMFVLDNGSWKSISAGLNIGSNTVTVYGDNQVNSHIRLGATFGIFGPQNTVYLDSEKNTPFRSGGTFAISGQAASANNGPTSSKHQVFGMVGNIANGLVVNVEKPCDFALSIYDALGRNLFKHVRQHAVPGSYRIPIRGTINGNGGTSIGFATLQRSNQKIVKKLILDR